MPVALRLFAAVCLLFALAQHPLALANDKETRAIALAETLVADAHKALNGADGDAGPALRAAVTDAFAFDVWQRFLLGTAAQGFSDAERDEVGSLLPGFMAHLYNSQFDKGLDTPPAVGGAKPARRDVLVSAVYKRTNGKDLPVDWRIRDFPDRGPKIIDVMVGGTSFLLLKRDEFAAIINKGGAAALIAHLRENSL